jgi:hypothetical protein
MLQICSCLPKIFSAIFDGTNSYGTNSKIQDNLEKSNFIFLIYWILYINPFRYFKKYFFTFTCEKVINLDINNLEHSCEIS